MLDDVSKVEYIYIATGYTDMQKVINSLSAIVHQNFKSDSFSNSLFLFYRGEISKIKALYLEIMVFYCYIKGLKIENSTRTKSRRNYSSTVQMAISIEQPKPVKKSSAGFSYINR